MSRLRPRHKHGTREPREGTRVLRRGVGSGGDTVNLTQADLDDTLTHLALVALGGPQGGGLLISDVLVGPGRGGESFWCVVQ